MNVKWVPELFYDLIGRIGPGALLLATALAAWFGPTQAWHEIDGFFQAVPERAGLLYFGLISFLSYLVGVVMSASWDSLAVMTKPKKRTLPSEDEERRNRKISQWLGEKDSQWGPETGLLSCCVTACIPEQGTRLAKLKAEENFCKTLISGLILILVLAFLSPAWALFWNGYSLDSVYMIGAMVLSAAACWRWKGFLNRLYECDLHSLAYLLATSRLPGTTKPEEPEPESLLLVLALPGTPDLAPDRTSRRYIEIGRSPKHGPVLFR